MSTRDIVSTFKEMYDADISATLVSNVTQAVITQVFFLLFRDYKI
jgi:transposase-like protein